MHWLHPKFNSESDDDINAVLSKEMIRSWDCQSGRGTHYTVAASYIFKEWWEDPDSVE